MAQQSVRARLARLERRVAAADAAAAAACPCCGLEWPGSVYACLETDGTLTPR